MHDYDAHAPAESAQEVAQQPKLAEFAFADRIRGDGLDDRQAMSVDVEVECVRDESTLRSKADSSVRAKLGGKPIARQPAWDR